MTNYLQHQTLALLGQQFLIQALYNSGSMDSAIADLLLQPRSATTGKEKAATALTGRIRGDAATMRQGAQNASEAARMAEIAKNATLSVAETLNEMQTLIQAVRNNEMTAAAATPTYQGLAEKLTSTIEGAHYNGIALLDKTSWDDDDRLTKVSDSTATVSIQVGGTASTFTLRDISAMKDLANVDLEAANSILDQDISDIATNLGIANSLSSGFQSLAGTYTSESKFLDKQAETLTQAALRAQSSTINSPETGLTEDRMKTILIDMLLREQGKLVDTSS